MDEKKTLQQLADEQAARLGIDPLATDSTEYYEYAPKSPDGVIWWVYKGIDRSKFQVEDGWTLVQRKITIEKGEWEDVGTTEALVE